MKHNEIIRALECCEQETKSCPSCPLARDYSPCSKTMARNALALIKELTVELEAMRGAANSYKMHNGKLTEENERLRGERAKFFEYKHGTLVRNALVLTKNKNEFDDFCKAVKADTVRKMQERLKAEAFNAYPETNLGLVVLASDIDRVAKELIDGN